MKLPAKIEPMFRGRAPHERFLALAMCVLLEKTEMLDEVVNRFVGQEIDWSTVVAGRPMFHFNSKTRDQIRSEGFTEAQLAEIDKAFVEIGLKPPQGAMGSTVTRRTGKRAEKPAPMAMVESETAGAGQGTQIDSQDGEPGQVDGQPQEEPEFAGHKLSELMGKSDEELLAIEGIGPASVTKIREAEEAATSPQA